MANAVVDDSASVRTGCAAATQKGRMRTGIPMSYPPNHGGGHLVGV